MFGFPRLAGRPWRTPRPARTLIDHVLTVLEAFTGPDGEQEDDITMVSLERVRCGHVGAGG